MGEPGVSFPAKADKPSALALASQVTN